MWIRTMEGDLVNMDKIDYVYYDSDSNTTRGGRDHDYCVISSGDTVRYVAAELRRLQQLVEVC